MEIKFEQVARPEVIIRLTADEADKLAGMMFFNDTIPTALSQDCNGVSDEEIKEGMAVFMVEIRQGLRDYGEKGILHFKSY